MKKGDFGTRLIFNVVDSAGLPVPLDGGKVKLLVRLQDEVMEYECELESETGRVSYFVEDGVFGDSGLMEMELDVTLPNGHWTTSRVKEVIKDIIE